jgi:hypothetical protein
MSKRFRIFNATLFRDQPADMPAWFAPILCTGCDLTREAANALADRAAYARQKLVLDIEHLPMDIRQHPRESVQASIRTLKQLIGWVRKRQPRLRLGMYSLMPMRDYWTPVAFPEKRPAWESANAFLAPLARAVDFICPSLYTFYDRAHEWGVYAKANIHQARQYGKPVWPFLWMNYHGSNQHLADQFIPADYWRMQLRLCRRIADGIVIWGGWGMAANAPRAWDDSAPWWQATKDFAERQ